MRKIVSVVYNANEQVTSLETIDAIKKSGFQNIFLQWYDDDTLTISQEEQLKYAKKIGLNIVFFHLGYQNINDIWLKGDKGDKLVERYKQNIKRAQEENIKLVVMHLDKGNSPPKYNELGLKRIKEIISYAEKKNVKIAFENLKNKGYLEYILKNIKSDNVGVCYDVGHDHLFFHDSFPFEKFKNKIFVVHFHDNKQDKDRHLLPLDGTVDWVYIIEKLKEAKYEGDIVLEISYRSFYKNISINTFFKKGYARALKIKDIFDK